MVSVLHSSEFTLTHPFPEMKQISRAMGLALSALALNFCALPAAADKIELNGGGTMYYEDTGEGAPVILLHGHTLDRRMWADQVEALQDAYRVIVPDLRGYGLSSDPKEGQQFTHMDDVVALMDSLHIQRAHVVGLSMGGFIAGDMLALCPERLLSCVMVSGETCSYTGPSHPRSAQEKAKLKASGDAVRRDIEGYKRRRIAVLKGACVVWNDHVCQACTEEVMDWGCWQAMNVPGRIYYGSEALAKLKQIKPEVPALIIYGDKERTSNSSLLNYLPNGRQVIFKHCGHMVNLEYPELFNETLLDWIAEVEQEYGIW